MLFVVGVGVVVVCVVCCLWLFAIVWRCCRWLLLLHVVLF